ncbi:MAG: sulfopyruvate decarboxylase subunit alpha [Candidatus Methanoplasma sp.]|jgi:sulfopyruvate decarboxylase subunit beta|nr:sulfopyruvate decarboxylase subunit alpha [Candidatus Methanoplasma sp.]
MNEELVAEILRSEGVDLIASLPCDRNRGFTAEMRGRFEVVDLVREEDGVGVCAGASLGGRRPAMSIQSSGLGNMANALMSLTSLYGLPLPVLASWRGVDGEPIEAQKPFNLRLPRMLDALGIAHEDVRGPRDAWKIRGVVRSAFEEGSVAVALIRPGFWGEQPEGGPALPERSRAVSVRLEKRVSPPSMTRLEAIGAAMRGIGDGDAVVSNIGVPSKEAFAARDRDLNFYMLGSYTQASPIGLGLALSTERRVLVIDGDGSVLGSSILPVIAAAKPRNLTILCLDNGAFGSTGNQETPAYLTSDTEAMALACGIGATASVSDAEGVERAVREARGRGPSFIQALIRPHNSDSPNIPLSAREIRDRLAGAI